LNKQVLSGHLIRSFCDYCDHHHTFVAVPAAKSTSEGLVTKAKETIAPGKMGKVQDLYLLVTFGILPVPSHETVRFDI